MSIEPIARSDSREMELTPLRGVREAPEQLAWTTSRKVITVGGGVLIAGGIFVLVKWNHKGVVVLSSVGGIGACLWLLARGNLTRTQQNLVQVVCTLLLYDLFAMDLQYFEDSKESHASAVTLCIPYLIYAFVLTAFFEQAFKRVHERVNRPHHVSQLPVVSLNQPWYACTPVNLVSYNTWQFAKIMIGMAVSLNGLHLPAPYNLAAIIPGNLLIGDGIGELSASAYCFAVSDKLRLEGDGYTSTQKAHLTAMQIMENFSLFVASSSSSFALRYGVLPALIPASIFVGLHQFFSKGAIEEERGRHRIGDEKLQHYTQIFGYGAAILFGGAVLVYSGYELWRNPTWFILLDSANTVFFVAGGFFASRSVSNAWTPQSGVFVSYCRENLIDNPVPLAYTVIAVNHAADQAELNSLAYKILGELGLSSASFLFGSEAWRILDSSLVHGVVKPSPASVVVLGHMLIPLVKALSYTR